MLPHVACPTLSSVLNTAFRVSCWRSSCEEEITDVGWINILKSEYTHSISVQGVLLWCTFCYSLGLVDLDLGSWFSVKQFDPSIRPVPPLCASLTIATARLEQRRVCQEGAAK